MNEASVRIFLLKLSFTGISPGAFAVWAVIATILNLGIFALAVAVIAVVVTQALWGSFLAVVLFILAVFIVLTYASNGAE